MGDDDARDLSEEPQLNVRVPNARGLLKISRIGSNCVLVGFFRDLAGIFVAFNQALRV